MVACVSFGQVQAQETVSGQILKVLQEKGVINAEEYADLRVMERRLLHEQDATARLEERVDGMIADLRDADPKVRYKQGQGFRWTTDDGRFRLTIGGRLQVRFTNHFYDENPGTNGENEADFSVPRARLFLDGHAFDKDLKYRMQLAFEGDSADTVGVYPNGQGFEWSSSNNLTELKDAYLDYTKWSAFKIRGGQFKVPYSRQWLTASGKQQFVDRAITQQVFSPGRDVGVMIHGSVGGEDEDLLEYYLGTFDGEGGNQTNDDGGLMYAFRLAINPLGRVKYTESDLEQSDRFRFALGFNGWLHEDDNHLDEGDDWSIGGDFAAFYAGFSALFELHHREDHEESDPDVESLGWLAQLGYFVVPHRLEVALRAASIKWDENGNKNSARREYLAVMGYFWYEHDMRVQLDFGRVEDHEGNTADNIDEWRLRMQIHVRF